MKLDESWEMETKSEKWKTVTLVITEILPTLNAQLYEQEGSIRGRGLRSFIFPNKNRFLGSFPKLTKMGRVVSKRRSFCGV